MKKYIILIMIMIGLISLFGFNSKQQAESLDNQVNTYEKFDFDQEKNKYELFIFDLLTPVVIEEVRKQYGVSKEDGVSIQPVSSGDRIQIRSFRETNNEYSLDWEITFNIKIMVSTQSSTIEGEDNITIGINPKQLLNDHPNIHNVKILKYNKSVKSE